VNNGAVGCDFGPFFLGRLFFLQIHTSQKLVHAKPLNSKEFTNLPSSLHVLPSSLYFLRARTSFELSGLVLPCLCLCLALVLSYPDVILQGMEHEESLGRGKRTRKVSCIFFVLSCLVSCLVLCFALCLVFVHCLVVCFVLRSGLSCVLFCI
jgi:hypothetical protein